ncbi:fas-binding factor 1 isoform X1 [Alosa sapidissima]|uniref:fas-binding factor 1 isoform X1 n=2 Tax=Alosa sapidissima TaxID=34773 RepID=UPI001C08177F|nr:fas-binding factor 1 isoform X1 [Alosa sapidissima]XP_041942934.1 fas-binding factor 1 isoform X1 [Alosa sapidissima]
MTTKQKKALQSSIDDVLGGLLDDDDFPAKTQTPSRERTRAKGVLPSRSGKKSVLDDDEFFSKLAEEAVKEDDLSDVSEADPQALLESMKDIDDMDADLFGSKKKPSSAPAQTKSYTSAGSKPEPSKPGDKLRASDTDVPAREEKKPRSAPASTAQSYKKFSFLDDDDGGDGGDDVPPGPPDGEKDFDDPLDDLLDDLDPPKAQKRSSLSEKTSGIKSDSPAASPLVSQKKTEKASTALAPKTKKRDELTFDDDEEDDLIDALGFGEMSTSKNKTAALAPKKESEPPQRPRTRLDEILSRGTSPHLLERPPTGEKKEQKQQPQQQKNPSAKDAPVGEEDLTFGSYQPTLAGTPEGRQSRRQSVRFSTEDISSHSPERKSKPSTPATPTSSRASRPTADWLGLKQDDVDVEVEQTKKTAGGAVASDASKVPPSPPSRPGSEIATSSPKITRSRQDTTKGLREVGEQETEKEQEDDWLTGALSRKKTKEGEKVAAHQDALGLGEEVDLDSFLSKGQPTPTSRRKQEDTLELNKDAGSGSSAAQRPVSPTPSLSKAGRGDQLRPTKASEDQRATITRDSSADPTSLPDPAPYPLQSHHSAQPLPSQPSKVVPVDPISHQRQQSRASIFPSTTPAAVRHPPPQLSTSQEQTGRAPSEQALPPSYAAQTWQAPRPLDAVLSSPTWLPQQRTVENTAPVSQPQVSLSAESLQQLLLQQQLASGWGLGGPLEVGVGALHRQRRETEQQTGEQLATLQARIIQLEGQVRTLQLERDQNQMLLESMQLRHKQDTELMENTHRARVKLLEESGAQRELRMRQENEDLAERLASVTRLADQERVELQAQHQRRLAQSQQDRDREVERLRDLQRKSILEMKKDHEEQVTRLKRLKDEEIDAVTSATSQTRSLTVVIEQMEQFSRRLGDLSSRVESTHEHTTQGLEQGARQRDEQLRVMQDRLGQQQRAMAEERARLQEVIAKMDTQLAEQQRQLEKERWRVSAEQAKAESALRGLEEERRTMSQQIGIEREELERAKSALLEEQQQVMQRCAEERRKLAAEWTQFHTQEKLRQDRVEREASRVLERDAHREGSIISFAQEQAELKLRAGELKQREDMVTREREALDRLREDLDRDKERLSATAIRLKTRAQEVESFSKLASEKFEEGERALQEARQVEAEHQTRLRSIHAQMERLRQQEQHLHKERMRVTEHRREVENMRHSLPIHLPPAPIYTDFAPVGNSQLMSSLATVQVQSPGTNATSPELLAKLAMLRHSAEKDRDFLQDEQFFLATLRTTPHTSFHT